MEVNKRWLPRCHYTASRRMQALTRGTHSRPKGRATSIMVRLSHEPKDENSYLISRESVWDAILTWNDMEYVYLKYYIRGKVENLLYALARCGPSPSNHRIPVMVDP